MDGYFYEVPVNSGLTGANRNLKRVNNISELSYAEENAKQLHSTFITRGTVLNTFLKVNFKVSCFDLLNLCSLQKYGSVFTIPIPVNAKCSFNHVDSMVEAKKILYLAFDKPNIHDSSYFEFQFIKADFKEDFDELELLRLPGFVYETQYFRFYLLNTFEFDLTVLYQQL